MSPGYIKDLFDVKITPYEFRREDILIQPRVNTTTYGLKSVRYQGAKLWNSLPNEIKSCPDLGSFKKSISNWSGPI